MVDGSDSYHLCGSKLKAQKSFGKACELGDLPLGQDTKLYPAGP